MGKTAVPRSAVRKWWVVLYTVQKDVVFLKEQMTGSTLTHRCLIKDGIYSNVIENVKPDFVFFFSFSRKQTRHFTSLRNFNYYQAPPLRTSNMESSRGFNPRIPPADIL